MSHNGSRPCTPSERPASVTRGASARVKSVRRTEETSLDDWKLNCVFDFRRAKGSINLRNGPEPDRSVHMNVLSVIACLLLILASVDNMIAADLVLPKAITKAFRISGGTHGVTAVGLDAAANIYVSGGFFGAVPFTGFPVSNKTTIGPAQGYPRFFVAKFSPSGDELLYLTEIGDTDAEYDSFGGG